MAKKVRAGCTYTYIPTLFDKLNPPDNFVKPGDKVKVVNKFGCPPANTMGMCYIEKAGKFAGMVCTNSLYSPKDMVELRELAKADPDLEKELSGIV